METISDPHAGAARAANCPAQACPVTASARAADPGAFATLAAGLGPGPFAQISIFASPEADLEALCRAAAAQYPRAVVVGCTTAGEITEAGYAEGQILAFALPRAGFDVEMIVVPELDRLDTRRLIAEVLRARQGLGLRAADLASEFAVLLVDGLSGREDELVGALSGALGAVPLIGGSAGDGGLFRRSLIWAGGRLWENAAALSLVRGRCEVRPFSIDHMRPTEARMVVTAADPARRAVARINDEPAAAEYARLLGLPVEALSPYVFAAHPVLARAGGRHHVRAIQGVDASGALIFFAAIAEGLVLTLAEPGDIAAHLDAALADLAAGGAPSAILGFDCIFRRIEATGRQRARAVSEILARHRVTGFSTYGEQIGAMHVNQTLTGFAFYPTEARR